MVAFWRSKPRPKMLSCVLEWVGWNRIVWNLPGVVSTQQAATTCWTRTGERFIQLLRRRGVVRPSVDLCPPFIIFEAALAQLSREIKKACTGNATAE